jgi:hypothetical protein
MLAGEFCVIFGTKFTSLISEDFIQKHCNFPKICCRFQNVVLEEYYILYYLLQLFKRPLVDRPHASKAKPDSRPWLRIEMESVESLAITVRRSDSPERVWRAGLTGGHRHLCISVIRPTTDEASECTRTDRFL